MSHRSAPFVVSLLAFAAVATAEEAAAPLKPEALVACPYTQAEIKELLGLEVEEGQAADMKTPAGRDVGCIYPVKNSSTAFAVRQTWDPANPASSNQTRFFSGEAKLRPIPGDPDGAHWKRTANADNEHRISLIYARGHVGTTVELYGGWFDEPQMRGKLVRMRRVP